MKKLLSCLLILSCFALYGADDSTAFMKRKDYEKKSSYTKFFTLNNFQVGQPTFDFIPNDLDYIQNYNPVYSFERFRPDRGRLGSTDQLMEYRLPFNLGFIYHQNPFESTEYTQENTQFFQTKTPYSYIHNINNFGKEDVFRVFFTQNVSQGLNFTIDYKVLNSPVEKFLNSETYQSHFRVYTNFFSKGGRYAFNAGYLRNVAKIYENGGIIDDSIYLNGIQTNPNFIRVNLNNAYTERKSNTYFLNQNYWLYADKKDTLEENDKTFGFIQHKFELNQTKLKYRDQFSAPNSFYDHSYIDPLSSSDTMRVFSMKNTLAYYTSDFERTKDKKLDVKWMAGFKNEYNVVRNAITYDPFLQWYAYSKLRVVVKRQMWLDLFYETQVLKELNPESKIEAEFKFNFDTTFSRLSYQDGISLRVGAQSNSSFHIYQSYFSNHFYWVNNFENQLTKYMQLQLQYKGWRFSATASNIDNYQYLTKQGPLMASESFFVYKIQLQKRLRFGWFIWDHNILYQEVSNPAYLHLPQIAIKQSYIAEFPVKSVAVLQVGIDAFYNTSYYGDAYMPALASYYWQDKVKTGNHMIADVFINVKIKSVTGFLKVSNVAQGLIGNYSAMMTPDYAISPRGFCFGVLWKFFD